MVAVGRVPAHASPGRSKHAQLGAREIAGACKQHHAALEIEENRQIPHCDLWFRNFRVDWNYFLYMCRQMLAKRKLFLLLSDANIEFSLRKAKGP
jgi:hypothetical protein